MVKYRNDFSLGEVDSLLQEICVSGVFLKSNF